MNLDYFNDENFHGSLKRFFKELNIPVSYIAEEPTTAEEILENTYKPNNPAHQLMDDVYFLGMVDDEAFKKQTDELYPELREKAGKDYEGILIFGVTLNSDKGRLPARGQMFEITRAFNREFHYTPVVVVFKYQHYISFANCERTAYEQKWREGEKVGRVSLLKDVDTRQPHTGHLKILQILEIRRKGKGAITSFEGLYQYWQEVFSISLLSKNFYRELSNWYFWALQHVDFPDDFEKDEQVRNAVNVIRLITRLMFCWFMKEKGLIPNTLFDEEELKDCLNFKDVNGSTYYKAILQNLFFATLNTEMQKDNPKSRQFMNRRYGIQEFYRHDRLFKDKHDALELFRDIPFLNGGLFENLDRNVGLSDEIRIDCFSNRPANSERLRVPDFLFFGDEDEVDLSKVYGDKKRKKETARGLIRILKSYKFTVAENTPIEEEIALDPELLGKVFENLLASYNPETQTTARKQTGSFYTPREIVNYMVDESLIAYFSNALVPADDEDLKKESDDRLRQLLSYSAQGHSFTDDEAEIIIGALDNAKILDPACGSGAFPMGILHKMVHMLGKVDPENARWKQKQMDKIAEISDITVREKLLEDVEESFKGNELDYGRKLYLIQNCVFGVDIQPIAVQIAKLRFFISLIADQKVDHAKKNLGILPLPNLETKFVAANTLIGIERSGQLMLQSPEIDKKQDELAGARQKHFSARSPKTKAKYRESDENLRAELARLLKERGSFGEDVAEKLANWDPYNQNASADFFDPEWMFGVKDGFDVVIGNPPYGAKYSASNKKYFQKNYESAKSVKKQVKGSSDTFSLFIDKGLSLGNGHSALTYIVPMSIVSSDSMTALHRMMFRMCETISVSTYSNRPQKIFASADQRVAIIICQKNNVPTKKLFTTKVNKRYKDTTVEEVINNLNYVNSLSFVKYGRLPKVGLPIEINILNKLSDIPTTLIHCMDEKGLPVYYRTSGGRYYNIITNFSTGSTKESNILVRKEYQNLVGAILSSSLYYWFYHIYSNNLDLKAYELTVFPIPMETFPEKHIEIIDKLYTDYLKDLQKNSKVKKANYATIDSYREYYARYSKHLIDKIDLAIQKSYGLSDKEVHFLINYDLEFRT
ncbi:MAG: hypothetical protein DRI57_05150 [Deltaproteobacteria bacterium]|nr:MAG: hypothetical protein DRI57_05150 [Deltaproteobacteria bacterium]